MANVRVRSAPGVVLAAWVRRWAPLGLLLFSIACGSPAPDAAGYVDEIARARAAKDASFRTSNDSPIPPPRRDSMLPLSYFPVDPEARVPAVLKRAEDQPVFEIPTSTGTTRKMRRVGVLEFTFRGQPLTLAALAGEDEGETRLFVPFTDLTTGTETYAAGRYLDLDRTPTGIYELDFNRAYHPFCYFDSRYDCPFPPRENRLPLAVRAGERLPSRREP